MPSDYRLWATENGIPSDAYAAYDLYLEANDHENRALFEAGNHDYTNYDEFIAADPPQPWDEFYQEWYSDQEELARENGWTPRR